MKITVLFFLTVLTIFRISAEDLVISTWDHPPYISRTDSSSSYILEVIKSAGKEVDLNFTFEFNPWKRGVRLLDSKKVWGTIPYVKTDARIKKYYFSSPLFTSKVKFFYFGKKRSIKFTKFEGLRPYRIGAVAGYYYENWFKKAGLNVQYTTKDDQNLEKLVKDRIDFTPMNELKAWYRINKLYSDKADQFHSLEPGFYTTEPRLMVLKNGDTSKHLLERFNEGMNIIKKNGKYQKILDKYNINF